MSTTQEHIKAARGLLRGFQGLEALAEALEAVGTAEERVYSLNQEIARLVDFEAAATTSAGVARETLANLVSDIAAAKAEAAGIRGRMTEAADVDAARIVSDAKAEASVMLGGAKEAAAAQKHKLAGLGEKAKALDLEIDQKSAELQGLNDAIAAIRAKLI